MCFSSFLPFFDYGDVIRGDRGNTTLMAELKVLHNKAARSILDLPSRPSLGRHRWKPLQPQKAQQRHIFTYKYINKLFMHLGQCLIAVFYNYNTRSIKFEVRTCVTVSYGITS